MDDRKREAHRVYVAWEPRPDRVPAQAKALLAAMDWLRTLPDLDGEWAAAAPRTGTRLPCTSETTAVRCLVAGGYPMGAGRTADPDYCKQSFYLGSFRRWRAQITTVSGVSRVLYGIETPNHLELLVRADLTPTALRQILIGLLSVYRPVWGFAASERFPAGPSPGEAVPSTGYLTYLSSWFGAPPALPEPAIVTPIPGFGTLVQAFPEGPSPYDRERKGKIRALETALRASGMLRPYEPHPPA